MSQACSVLRRLIDLTIGLRSPHQLVRVSREVKADLLIWQQIFKELNGKSFFLHDKWDNIMSLQLFTDAAGARGFGAVFGSHRCYGAWPKEWLGRNIAVLECCPVVLSLPLWGDHIRDKCITFSTDNEDLIHLINKTTCKDKYLMIFVRKLELVCLKHNILFRAKHSGFQQDFGRCSVSFSDSMFQEASTSLHGSDANKSSIPSSSTQLASIVR